MSAAEIDRMVDAVWALDTRGRELLLARVVGIVGGGGTLDAETLRRVIAEERASRPSTPSARPSSQAGLASFVHLRSEPGATRTGS